MTIVASAAFLLPTSRLLWWGWGIMKNIDVKSIIIGALLTSTIFLCVAAVPRDTGKPFVVSSPESYQQWDDKQVLYVKRLEWKEPPGHANRLTSRLQPQGFEPFAATDKHIFFRKRTQ